jgi:hypothetical protein
MTLMEIQTSQLLSSLHGEGMVLNASLAGNQIIDFSQRLLDHLKEVAFYSAKDLVSIEHSLQEYRKAVERGKYSYSPHLLALLEARISVCDKLLHDLQENLASLTPELRPIYEKLVSILRSLSACNTRSKVGAQVKPQQRRHAYLFVIVSER